MLFGSKKPMKCGVCIIALCHVRSWMATTFIFSSPLENLCLHGANGLNSVPLVNISVLPLQEMHRLSIVMLRQSGIWEIVQSLDYSGHKFKALWDRHYYLQNVNIPLVG